MRLSVSNIAWEVAQDGLIADLLVRNGIPAIDVAPTKYFKDPEVASDKEVLAVRRWWEHRGIVVSGFQSLLFNKPSLNLFGSQDVRRAMINYLGVIIRIAATMGADNLVFGSPRNRDRSGINDRDADDIASEFFYQVGELAVSNSVKVCIEPNPSVYGCNFLTNSNQAGDFVRKLSHPGIGMQLDTGALAINGDSVESILGQFADLVPYAHASEPELAVLGSGTADHEAAGRALNEYLPDITIAIEMKASSISSNIENLNDAILVADMHYRTET